MADTKMYILCVRWKTEWEASKVTEFGNVVKTFAGWLRFNVHTWLLKTDLDQIAIRNKIDRTQLGIDELLILEVLPKTRNGYAERWVWDWLDK
jgi:hypothetical protein